MTAVSLHEKIAYWENDFKNILPSGYRDKLFTNISLPASVEEIQILKAWDPDTDNFGFLLMGDAGIGKTFILMTMMNRILDECYRHGVRMLEWVAYYPVSYLIYKFRSDRNSKEFEKCMTVKFLFLDDLGSENTTDFAREHFFTVLDLRCQKNFPTFITTNLDANELKEKYGERVLSRIKEMCIPLILKGKDRRTDVMRERINDLKKR